MSEWRILIDSGNTRIKWALVNVEETEVGTEDPARQWLAQGALAQAGAAPAAESLRAALAAARDRVGGQPFDAWIANVAGAGVNRMLASVLTSLGLPTSAIRLAQTTPACDGLRNGYREPLRLGVDRWAAAVWARRAHPERALLVATLGTATTLDCITADGRFAGGLIMPGLPAMLGALGQTAAALPALSLGAINPSDLAAALRSAKAGRADGTPLAMLAGCIQAQIGAIQRSWATVKAEGGEEPRCLLAGGAANAILPLLDFPVWRYDNLVLAGLARLAALDALDAA